MAGHKQRLYTVGHSTHPMEVFLELLQGHEITAVADVRSSPYSRYNSQFNREPFQADLRAAGIRYVFLGDELGPRTTDPACLVNGKASYQRIAETAAFQEGLRRVHRGVRSFRVALLCAEKDPVTCHRMILVCRHLRNDDLDIRHIREDGTLEANTAAEHRLMTSLDLTPGGDLFTSHEELLELAYDKQGDKIAYQQDEDRGGEPDHE